MKEKISATFVFKTLIATVSRRLGYTPVVIPVPLFLSYLGCAAKSRHRNVTVSWGLGVLWVGALGVSWNLTHKPSRDSSLIVCNRVLYILLPSVTSYPPVAVGKDWTQPSSNSHHNLHDCITKPLIFLVEKLKSMRGFFFKLGSRIPVSVIQRLMHPIRPVFFSLVQSLLATSSSQKIGTLDARKKNQWLSMTMISLGPVSSIAISGHALSSTAGILASGDLSLFLVRQRLATYLRQLPGRLWFSSPALR